MNTLTANHIDISDKNQLQQLSIAHGTHRGLVGWKDRNHRYLFTNDLTAKKFGFSSSEDILTSDVYDTTVRSPVVALAGDFYAEDKQVMESGRPLRTMLYACYADNEWQTLLGEKTPILNTDNEVIGLSYYYIDVTDSAIAKRHFIHAERNQKQINYSIDASRTHALPLTQRQSECLYFLLRGNTATTTATHLGISVRTVETHLAIVKDKFQATSRADLIAKAIDLGYLEMLPSILL